MQWLEWLVGEKAKNPAQYKDVPITAKDFVVFGSWMTAAEKTKALDEKSLTLTKHGRQYVAPPFFLFTNAACIARGQN